jgi:hypothetical protein
VGWLARRVAAAVEPDRNRNGDHPHEREAFRMLAGSPRSRPSHWQVLFVPLLGQVIPSRLPGYATLAAISLWAMAEAPAVATD